MFAKLLVLCLAWRGTYKINRSHYHYYQSTACLSSDSIPCTWNCAEFLGCVGQPAQLGVCQCP